MKLIESINLNNIRGDITGGITAAIVALPFALAMGLASGAGAEAGLYGAIITGFFFSSISLYIQFLGTLFYGTDNKTISIFVMD